MMKVLLKGPILTQSGYGHHARTVYRALKTREDLFEIFIHPITWGHTSWLWEDCEERREIDKLLQKTIGYTQAGGKFDMSLQVTIPNEWEKIAPINIGVTAGIETTKIAPLWFEKSLLMDKIITISHHSKTTYENTVFNVRDENGQTREMTCPTPVEYVSYPVRQFEPEALDLNLESDFNFLAVAQLSPRKNMEQLIRVFVDRFRENENIGLVVKANTAKNSLIDRNHTHANFRQILEKFGPRKCKIYFLHGYLSDKQMAGLYNHPKIKAFVSTTHGEGFGLPIFEAAANGMPVAATDWSGHLDFLYMPQKQKNGKMKNKHMFNRINYTLQKIGKESVWDGVLTEDSMWAYPEDTSVKMNLVKMYEEYDHTKKRAKKLQKWINQEFTEEKKYSEFLSYLGEFTKSSEDEIKEIENLFSDLAEE